MKMIDAPSPNGTNLSGMKVPACWFAKPGLALDAAPNIRSWKLGRDANVYPAAATGEEPMGVDVDGLLGKLEAGDALNDNDLDVLRRALKGEATDESGSNWKSGPLGPTDEPKIVTDETEKMRDELRAKGFSEDDVHRILPGPQGADVLPKNGQTNNEVLGGKMGGRISHPIGDMAGDDISRVLAAAGRRLAPRRGDGPPSVSPRAKDAPPPPNHRGSSAAALGMDAVAEEELNRMFGTGRIGFV
jgi:hypothetical protein